MISAADIACFRISAAVVFAKLYLVFEKSTIIRFSLYRKSIFTYYLRKQIMAIKVRQRKKNNNDSNRDPRHLMGQRRTWADDEREKTKSSFRRNFIAIIGIMVLILIILVTAAINATISSSTNVTQITAADTFSVTQVEQQQMSEYAESFAEGVLYYAYCSDENTALSGKSQALSLMADNTDAYTQVEALEQVDPIIAPENFAAVVTTPAMQETTQAYAGSFTYEFDGVAADTSVTSSLYPYGTFADSGYHFTLTFSYVTDSNSGDSVWVISDAVISAK